VSPLARTGRRSPQQAKAKALIYGDAIATGMLASPPSLTYPRALTAGFIALSDELDEGLKNGSIAHWLRGDTPPPFTREFVVAVRDFLYDCLDTRERRGALQ
jgi:hypothetical protein